MWCFYVYYMCFTYVIDMHEKIICVFVHKYWPVHMYGKNGSHVNSNMKIETSNVIFCPGRIYALYASVDKIQIHV